MPLHHAPYLFLCRDCNKKFEHTLHISELGKTPVKCPHCGSEKTEQLAAAFAAVTSKNELILSRRG
jgi:putative FmdB family regulatory protein